MFKRALCIILVIMLFTVSFAFAEENSVQSFDFRLAFRMDGDVFPPSYRLRARGYATLVNRLSLDGRITWCSDTRSLDLSASLYFTDKPEVAVDFRLFGIPSRLFFTSPLIGRETVLLNMAAFLEFTVKAQNTLGIDMPWLAFLYPYCTEHSLNVLPDAWNTVVGPVNPDTEISVEKLKQVSEAWEGLLQGDVQLNRWIAALDSLSSYPSLITDEFSSLPAYFYYNVCGGRPLALTPTEYEVLKYLMEHADQAVSREELLNTVWGFETAVETRATDDTVRRLRQKLDGSGIGISAVWGYGFRLEELS